MIDAPTFPGCEGLTREDMDRKIIAQRLAGRHSVTPKTSEPCDIGIFNQTETTQKTLF